ncbi:hypothetical protein NDU88_008166 [Pleurodeles waltl]|uniref:t-SNARE coiled-coil homology domain-containing protein n=1 Tax=Pleurodeles waltl TaxID=8319 RepID=A0AAV7P2V3_PLEWA|nr:hypothetical protein NDU88_008166 [Pleurodeles waltl]
MPVDRSSSKNSGKLVRQLLFSEALLHSKTPAPAVHPTAQANIMADQTQETTMDHILQEISAVGQGLEGMDNAMASLTVETKSIHLDIAGFQSRVTGLEQRMVTVETHVTSSGIGTRNFCISAARR